MKPFILNSNSLHFKLAKMAGLRMPRWREVNDPISTDICEYTRYVLKGVFLSVLMFIAAIGVAYILTEVIFSIGFSLFYQMNMFSEIGQIGLTLLVVLIFMVSVIWASMTFSEYRTRRKEQRAMQKDLPEVEPSFLKTAYSSFKGKYCVEVQINFKSEE